jgi:hypothetical protein
MKCRQYAIDSVLESQESASHLCPIMAEEQEFNLMVGVRPVMRMFGNLDCKV